MSFSVLILTCNKEHDLASCIESVGWCDDIVVLDSGSADATLEIARSLGVRVVQHPFVNFAEQRNWALHHIKFRYPWGRSQRVEWHLSARLMLPQTGLR
jgi:glycosyltransferase involved in cell wall biosynthesis